MDAPTNLPLAFCWAIQLRASDYCSLNPASILDSGVGYVVEFSVSEDKVTDDVHILK